MAEKTTPPDTKIPADSSIEMTWKTFAGEYARIYEALLRERNMREGGKGAKEDLLQCLRAHITRGIGYLTARKDVRDVAGLVGLVGSGV